MTSAGLSRKHSGAFPARIRLSRFAPSLFAALAGIVVMVLFVDGPAARFAAGFPVSFTTAVALVVAPFKGSTLLALSLTVAVAAAVATWASGGILRKSRTVAWDAGFVFVATGAALVCATVLKIIIGRARPEILHLVGPHAFAPFSTGRAWTSLPSGETSMAAGFFGACALLAWTRRRDALAGLLLFPPALVALSRPIVGAHYPSDVLSGLLVSAVLVPVVHRIWQELRAGRDHEISTVL